ncbi:Putative AC9 transposase-like protein [Cladobotryum mycophilum]|uniref:AC9 transposase-like protein n=1 Tax=Cladobotryum mycophilum TaxID=491253 RepID=A0ABR0SRL9_9HYPO
MSLTIFNKQRRLGLISQLQNATDAASASESDLTGRDGLESLPFATYGGKRYVLEKHVTKKGSRGRTTWILEHGSFVYQLIGDSQLGSIHWVCSICDQRGETAIFNAVATSSPRFHLWNKHRLEKPTNSNRDVPLASESDNTLPPSKRLRHHTAISRIQIDQIHELMVAFIVDSDQPFSALNNEYLQEIFIRFNPGLSEQINWSRDSQRKQLDRVFDNKKGEIQSELRKALTQIHLGFDLWTSPNRLAILGVTGHFLSSNGSQQQRLLALKQHPGAHSGEKLATTLKEVIYDWGIQDQLGTIISDNASNNDTCLLHLFNALDPSMTEEDIGERRIRCYGHILNLVARAYLYGQNSESFEQESQLHILADHLDDDLEHWRKKGPIGKLHNIVKFIRASPQRTEEFKKSVPEDYNDGDFMLVDESDRELELIINNETRWNSTYLMIERALVQGCSRPALVKQQQLQTFLNQNQLRRNPSTQIPEDDILTIEDWRLLIEIREVLKPLWEQTMRCQGWGKNGNHGRLWEIITGFEFLLTHFEHWKAYFTPPTDEEIKQTQSQIQSSISTQSRRTRPSQHNRPSLRSSRSMQSDFINSLPEHTRKEYTTQAQRINCLRGDSRQYLRVSITNAWQKLNEYYIRLGDSPLYAASVILHPSFGYRWLEDRWNSEEQLVWLRDAKEGLANYWARWYENRHEEGPTEAAPLQGAFQHLIGLQEKEPEKSNYTQWLETTAAVPTNRATELERYYSLGPMQLHDPIAWWISKKDDFPTLSRLALDILAIPAMSADCERVFSLAKLTLSSQRLSMKPETLEKIQCMKNWL